MHSIYTTDHKRGYRNNLKGRVAKGAEVRGVRWGGGFGSQSAYANGQSAMRDYQRHDLLFIKF